MRWTTKLFTGVLLAILLAAGIVEIAGARLARPPYSAGEINSKLLGGVQQAIRWDRYCYDGLRRERRSGSDPRTAVNQAPSYQSKIWLSLADTATQNNSARTAPILVDYGTRSVPLQLNMIKFLCAALVSPDGQGADFPYTNFRVVRPGTGANDRRPNGIPGSGGSTVNGPALTNTRLRIERIRVTQGNGRIQGTTTGRFIGTPRQGDTRYWFSNPVDFRFVSNSPNGITSDTVIRIRFTLRGYNTYYYSVYQCYTNWRVYFSPESAFGRRCDTTDVTLAIRVNVRFRYDLEPHVGLFGQRIIESGGQASVDNYVTKASGGTNTEETDWRLTRYIYRPNVSLSSGQRSSRQGWSGPCSAFTSSGRISCSTVQRDPDRRFSRGRTTFSPRYRYTASPTIEAGSLVCFVSSISRPTQSLSPRWRHSDMRCLIVVKKPKMQVWGSDVRARGRIETSTSQLRIGGVQRTYGSWVEYGAFSTGPNVRFGSGSALNGGNRYSMNRWHPLTFANINDSGSASYGYFALPPAESLAAQFVNEPSDGAPSGNLNNLASGTYKANSLTISRSDIGQDATGRGKSIIIVVNGTVTINDDITYASPGGTFTQARQIPQVVIVANRIDIRGSVERIDAWLLTTSSGGTINTCSDVDVSDALTINDCDRVLTVNGPIETAHLYLRRTAGAEDGIRSGNPAEILNMRADALIWSHRFESEEGKAEIVHASEVPPRF